MEYLGFWETRDGVNPIYKKIQAITNIENKHGSLLGIGILPQYVDKEVT